MSEDHVFVFGSFRFMPRQQLLIREGRPVKLGSRAMDILHLLLKNAGEPVSKRALHKFVWPDSFVHESNLKVHIHSLRRALGETFPQPSYIATVAGRGYRFIPSVAIEPVAPTKVPIDVAPVAHGLPAQRALIGRDSKIDRVAGLLAERGLVTLVGPGGVGKTTVAIAVAHRMQQCFPDGIYFVDFSSTNDSSVVPHVLAAACGIRGRPADIVAAIVNYLTDRRVLIVMDNCEHVLASVALIATRFREAGTTACLFATSLEPLRLSHETVQLIEPLDYPSTPAVSGLADALRYPSIELFAARALEWADYQLTDGDVAAIATLCERLGGLPLAIELAATKLDQYSPVMLLESLDRRFSLLRNDDPAAHRRHRTLWATLDWSYELLSVGEATVFRLISVFSGSFAQEDVAAMAQAAGYAPYQTAVALGGLVAKSLVAAEVDGDSLRYRMLDCSRAYAAERLSQEPLAHEVQSHFARFMLTVLERFVQERAEHPLTAHHITPYKRRLDDLREALSWCFDVGNDPALGIRLTIAAIPLWYELSLMAEEQFQVERALERSASSCCGDGQRAELALSRAWSMTSHRLPESANAWIAAVELAEQSNDVNQRLRALQGQAVCSILAGRFHEGLRSLSDFRQIAVLNGNGSALPDHERYCAMAEVYLGRLTAAHEKLERLSRGLARGEQSVTARYQVEPYVVIQTSLSLATWLMGYPDQAAVIAAKAVEFLGRAGHPVAQSWALGSGAIPIALWNGDLEGFERYTAHLGSNRLNGCTYWGPVHRLFHAVGHHSRGERHVVDDMRSAIDDCRSTGFLLNVPMFLGLLANAFLENGAIAEAEHTVEEALILQAGTQERYSFPDLLRAKAKILEARRREDLAELVLHEALAQSTEMSARSLQLRVACDLAALWIAQGREAEAAALLGPIYEAFSEGYGTKDLLRASALLESMREAVQRTRVIGR